MDPKTVCQVETFQLEFENRTVTLIRLTPIMPDHTAAPRYQAATEIMQTMLQPDGQRFQRAVPLVADVEAASLSEAISKTEAALKAVLDSVKAEAAAASKRLVLPGTTTTIPNLRGEAKNKP